MQLSLHYRFPIRFLWVWGNLIYILWIPRFTELYLKILQISWILPLSAWLLSLVSISSVVYLYTTTVSKGLLLLYLYSVVYLYKNDRCLAHLYIYPADLSSSFNSTLGFTSTIQIRNIFLESGSFLSESSRYGSGPGH